MLILPHGDPVATELTWAIHDGDIDALRRLLAERPELATARMIGRKGLEGGSHPATRGRRLARVLPNAPAAVAILLEGGADPNDCTGATARRRPCTGRPAPTT